MSCLDAILSRGAGLELVLFFQRHGIQSRRRLHDLLAENEESEPVAHHKDHDGDADVLDPSELDRLRGVRDVAFKHSIVSQSQQCSIEQRQGTSNRVSAGI